MVLRKQLPPLKLASLQALENCIFEMCRDIFEDQFSTLDDLVYWSELLIEYITNETLWCLHDQVAWHILQATVRFIAHVKTPRSDGRSLYDDWAQYKGLAILRIIVSIVPYLKITVLKLADWPRPVRSILTQLLHKMTNLKILDTRCSFDGTGREQLGLKILSSFDSLTNLTSFTMAVSCTDEILAALSKRCRSIRRVLAFLSSQVTNYGCECLQELTKLQEVRLDQTGVTPEGFGKLLTKSKSQNLLDIGVCSSVRNLLDLLKKEPARTYQLRRLQCHDLDAEHLILLCEYFPFLNELSVDYFSTTAPDFHCLSTLERLSRIKVHKLFSTNTPFPDPVGRYLSVKGEPITYLSLGRVEKLLTSNILNIAKSCPNIEYLEFYQCSFADGGEFPRGKLTPIPFQKLTIFDWSLNDSLAHADFVLRNAQNIETLIIKPGLFSIDDFFTGVFNHNPLNDLRTLRVDSTNNMSADLLQLIVMKCRNISLIGNFQYSNTIPKWRLKKFQDSFTGSNCNLTIV